MLLNKKSSFYKVCFDSMQLGILVFNHQKNIVLANNPSCKIFGYKKGELAGKNIDELFKYTLLFNDFIKNPKSKKFKSTIEITGKSKKEKSIFLELSFGILNFEGETYYKILLNDINIRKEKEQQIKHLNAHLEGELEMRNKELEKLIVQLQKSLNKEIELNNLKLSFITLASHEFKTPLSGILSSTELMDKYADLGNVKKRKEHLKKVNSMVNHLNAILDDFLTLDNIEKGIIKPSYNFFKISYLKSQILKKTTPFLRNNQVLKVEMLNDDNIYHDIKIITIILSNLLYNSIKYSGENGIVKVTLSSSNSHIIFTVEDDGIGIPKDEQSLIFNRFFRAKNVLYYPGTGNGLNIVKGYVSNLNGKISFKSTENQGTIFNVKLPKITNNEKESIIN
jgi:hypothetical protein